MHLVLRLLTQSILDGAWMAGSTEPVGRYAFSNEKSQVFSLPKGEKIETHVYENKESNHLKT